jgi:hypothetical protein
MYSAAATLSIVYSQEVCGTEEKVGGMEIRCLGIQDKLEKNLSIVEHRKESPQSGNTVCSTTFGPSRDKGAGAR